MSTEEQIQNELLAEMRALEDFRAVYAQRHPQSMLAQEDPDVLRLMEALAYFSLRTRRAALRNLQSTLQRLFRAYFDFLLTPMPAMALVQAVPNHHLVEAAVLPRGAEVRIEAPDGTVGSFRTLAATRVLPITLERTHLFPLPSGHLRLVLDLRARSPRQEPVGLLRFHVRYLDDYPISLQILHELRTRLRKALVVYHEPVLESSQGPACEVSFGSVPEHDHEPPGAGMHPLSRIRSFFHFPEQELFLNVAVPPSKRPWSRLSLCLDLEPPWPSALTLTPDLFQLFTTPVLNLTKEVAETVLCDGTRDSYPIRHPNPERRLALHSVLGVYHLSERGPEPLPSGALPGSTGGRAFEIEEEVSERGRQHHLLVRMPEAFAVPQKLAVEALWHQPDFAERAVGALRVSLPDRYVRGLSFQVRGMVRPALESALRDDPNGMLALMALRMKAPLELAEVRALLSYLGTLGDGPYRELPQRLRELRAEVAPDAALRGSGLRHRYTAVMDPYEPADQGRVGAFLLQVQALLDAWTDAASVELREKRL